MRRLLIFALVLLGLCLPSAALAQTNVPSVIVDGRGSLLMAPEEGVITVGVRTEAPTAAQASQANAATMQKVVAALKKTLGDKGRLETAGYWLRPLTTWDKAKRRNITTGYKASHEVRVTSRDPLALAGLLDAAVAAGANTVSGPDWRLADPQAAEHKALALAYADAKARALALAQAAGLRLGAAFKISVSGAGRPSPVLNRTMAKALESTPLQPSEVQVTAEVSCEFALLPSGPGPSK
jgi:uncharacterized protein YggE